MHRYALQLEPMGTCQFDNVSFQTEFIDKMNLLEILKKIFSCAMPQAASEGDMDSVSPSDKTK